MLGISPKADYSSSLSLIGCSHVVIVFAYHAIANNTTSNACRNIWYRSCWRQKTHKRWQAVKRSPRETDQIGIAESRANILFSRRRFHYDDVAASPSYFIVD